MTGKEYVYEPSNRMYNFGAIALFNDDHRRVELSSLTLGGRWRQCVPASQSKMQPTDTLLPGSEFKDLERSLERFSRAEDGKLWRSRIFVYLVSASPQQVSVSVSCSFLVLVSYFLPGIHLCEDPLQLRPGVMLPCRGLLRA